MEALKASEIISIFENSQLVSNHFTPEAVTAAYVAALAALRRTAQENKPLTLEELRRMDGEPVWVEYRAPIKVGKPWGARSEWMLVCDEIMHGNRSCVPFSRIGIDAQAYARRPEEK